MTTKEDREFVEKLKTIGFVNQFKPGSTKTRPVVNETDGSIGGATTEHYSGRVDVEVRPKTIDSRITVKE